MQISDKAAIALVSVILLQIMILTPPLPLPNSAFAQDLQTPLHNQTLYEVLKQTSGFDKNAQIDVAKEPDAIGRLLSLGLR